MSSSVRAARLLLAAGLAVSGLTCGGDTLDPGSTEGPEVPSAAAAGAPATVTLTRQPPASALDMEVWAPTSQPSVLVKDAAGTRVSGVQVSVALASGTGSLQGVVTRTTNVNGVAAFTDLGIAGTGTHTLGFVAGSVSATSAGVIVDPLPPEATAGKWELPVAWDIVPLHINLLPSGKLLAWGKLELSGGMGMPRLWDPSAGLPTTARMVAADTMLFCAGHAFLPDGRLLVSGGHMQDNRGIDVTNIFDPVSETWVPGLAKMAKGRWYPTVTTLPDGRMVTVAGRDTAAKVVVTPEVWENEGWVQLPGASLSLPYYPRQFVAPNGRLFYAGERVQSRWLDVDAVTANGRGRWTTSSTLKHVWPYNRDYGAAAMYETGKILYVGGGGDLKWSTGDPKAGSPTATAETIDLTASGPRWSSTDPMHSPRRHLNATILPDGQVLATGGTSAGGFNTLSGAVRAAELWNPANGTWTLLASNSVDRVYHSVSILLPDGTVLHGASGDAKVPGSTQSYPREASHEIFKPPYLFKGVRPTITGLSKTTVTWGESFVVTTPFAAQITGVRWIRLGSVTHAFDANQRANTLAFRARSGGVSVTAPARNSLAPPGDYLLFILNRNGVPSLGRVVRVR